MRLFIFIACTLLFQYYIFQIVRTVSQNRWLWIAYIALVVCIYGALIYQAFELQNQAQGINRRMSYVMGVFFALFAFQMVALLFLVTEDIFRIPQAIYRFFTQQSQTDYFPSRRKFLAQIALGLGAIPFGALLYGMVKGRYNYKVLHYTLNFPNLPKAFEGLKVLQISDFHAGSFDDPAKVQYGLDLIQKQQADVILFTGDMVNNKATEAEPWVEALRQLTAPLGKFSVLGNHDYGDYVAWGSPEEKVANLERLKSLQAQMGFRLLCNEAVVLERDTDRIAIVGVENWGKGGFKKAGDLNRATAQIRPDDFKILMSHDPSHWEAEVLPHPMPFEMTLSGHTHGMQFGIEIPGWFKWSPVQWRYKQWVGLYKKADQWLHVNRGFGYLAYPGRVGMWPEITLLELRGA